ncbi:MAG: 3-phosphoserine/phosphohydroxythreonine transaminase [Chitinispirillaceae bacterium]|nr:3-phosphoserine/phosphohydroxythreonine transaminase [Chitinispirillaceae bacterium]
MARVYNFSAGPSMLPEPVLKKAAAELLEYPGTGQSVMEMSHRSPEFQAIIEGAEAILRKIMTIPSNYRVLFLQGGASIQFAMVPLNLFGIAPKADFVHTGTWSKKAIAEAKRYGTVRTVASSEDRKFSCIPALDASMFDTDAAYVHITTNNTIEGTRYRQLPDTGTVPLVADMSSNILSEVYDVTKFGIIYAGAQKNIAPAGVTVVIVRDDLLGKELPITPTMLNYKIHAEGKSLYNTPPCYCIYMAKLTFEWIEEQGGIAALQGVNERKAALLYDFLDNSKMFKGTVVPEHRSLMNIPFTSPSEEIDKAFIKESTAAGFVNLKGHRSVGGMRASIYNAMPEEGVRKLVEFMKTFEKNHL